MSMIGRLLSGTVSTTANVGLGVGRGIFGGGVGARTLIRGGVGAGVGGMAGAFGEDYNTLTGTLQGAARGAMMGAGLGVGSAWTMPILGKAWRGVGARALRKDAQMLSKAKVSAHLAGEQAKKKAIFQGAGPSGMASAYQGARSSRMRTSQYIAGAGAGMSNWASAAWSMTPKNPRTIAAGLGVGFAAAGLSYMADIPSEIMTGQGWKTNALSAAGADYDVSLPSVNSMINVSAQYDHKVVAAQEMMSASMAPTGMVGTGPQMAGPMHNALQRSTGNLVQGLHRSRHG